MRPVQKIRDEILKMWIWVNDHRVQKQRATERTWHANLAQDSWLAKIRVHLLMNPNREKMTKKGKNVCMLIQKFEIRVFLFIAEEYRTNHVTLSSSITFIFYEAIYSAMFPSDQIKVEHGCWIIKYFYLVIVLTFINYSSGQCPEQIRATVSVIGYAQGHNDGC